MVNRLQQASAQQVAQLAGIDAVGLVHWETPRLCRGGRTGANRGALNPVQRYNSPAPGGGRNRRPMGLFGPPFADSGEGFQESR